MVRHEDKLDGLKEQDVLQNMIRDKGVIEELGLNVRFLNTLYFSGFCKDSRDVGAVATVHANCCRSIRAKVADLKRVLRDWKRYKSGESVEFGGPRDGTRSFSWSKHIACINSWHKRF
ncbi:UNVERIFIED_CONTAM: hypothetical protein Sradi_3339200 [Sesamum radiatum]|uniref:Nucleotide-diphospho-sugar transferase domain-containing protein n=1 Tax=Sesamum radiatum TaxID=300843 RepID=A0AAW2R1Y9_SESRA